MTGEGPGAVCLHYIYGHALAHKLKNIDFYRCSKAFCEREHGYMLDLLNLQTLDKYIKNSYTLNTKTRQRDGWPDIIDKNMIFADRTIRYYVELAHDDAIKNPEWLKTIQMQHKFQPPTHFQSDHENIVVHVRRGELAKLDIDHPRRVACTCPDKTYIKLLKDICTEKCNVHVLYIPPFSLIDYSKYKDRSSSSKEWSLKPFHFTVDDEPMLQKFINDIRSIKNVNKVTLYPGARHFNNQLDSEWRMMIHADKFIGSWSSFSWCPAILNKNKVYFPRNFIHPIPEHWSMYDYE